MISHTQNTVVLKKITVAHVLGNRFSTEAYQMIPFLSGLQSHRENQLQFAGYLTVLFVCLYKYVYVFPTLLNNRTVLQVL